MSAWIVSENHIALLVEALYRYEVPQIGTKTPDEVGQTLWRENHRSVNYRYSERTRTPKYHHVKMAHIRKFCRNPLMVFKQLCCYVYQSDNHHGWMQSEASKWMIALEMAITRTSGELHLSMPACEALPWGID